MTQEQALNLLAQAATQYKGTLEEHQTLQKAVNVLDELINPKVKPDKKK